MLKRQVNSVEFIIADPDKKDLCFLSDNDSLDIDIGADNDFQFSTALSEYNAEIHKENNILYCLGTEYGGILNDPEISTRDNKITLTGDTFRGMLKKKYIEPENGEDYFTISGELNSCISRLINNAFSDTLFKVSSADTGINVAFTFDRYCSLLDGINKMLASKGCRLSIKAVLIDDDFFIELSAQPVVDYSDDIEFSQDSNINFKIKRVTNKYNYMIALGKGELKDRQVLCFYCDKAGQVSSVDSIPKGDDIKIYLYDNTSSEDLQSDAIKKFAEINSSDEYSMTIKDDMELELGDIVGGRDYITGMTIAQPVTRKIIKYSNKKQSISYEIGGKR